MTCICIAHCREFGGKGLLGENNVRHFLMFLSALGALLSMPVMAQPALDLRGVDEALASEPTKVMVLGSAHLGGNENVTSDTLTPLIGRLANFDPQIIAIEAVPGETCEMMRSYASEYQKAIRQYCNNVERYRDESGMTAAQAANHIRITLAQWPEDSRQPFWPQGSLTRRLFNGGGYRKTNAVRVMAWGGIPSRHWSDMPYR